MSTAWETLAGCRGIESSLFYPSTETEATDAKRVCAQCPVAEECLEHAIVHREKDGVWGGHTAIERQRLVRRRRRRRRLELVSAC